MVSRPSATACNQRREPPRYVGSLFTPTEPGAVVLDALGSAVDWRGVLRI